MNPLSAIGRAGAGLDGASALSGANRPGGISFGKSLEYVIGTSQGDHQRYSGGNGGMQSPRLGSLHTNDQQVAAAFSAQTGVQGKFQPFTSRPATRGIDANAASDSRTQQPQGTTVPQPQKAGNYDYGTPGAYQFDSVPSTLDPGSMAFLLAWLGGGSTQQIEQQQQAYLDTYRQRYPNGVPGVKNYITPTTNYLTHTS